MVPMSEDAHLGGGSHDALPAAKTRGRFRRTFCIWHLRRQWRNPQKSVTIKMLPGSGIWKKGPMQTFGPKTVTIKSGESVVFQNADVGMAIVLFGILFGAIVAEKLTVPKGIEQYFLAVAGGAVLGSTLGYLASRITGTVDDPQIEITLTTILAYGSYLLAFHLHLSGVIATAPAGLMLGNFGAKKRYECWHTYCDAVILGVHFVRHEFSRVSFDWPGNPCA